MFYILLTFVLIYLIVRLLLGFLNLQKNLNIRYGIVVSVFEVLLFSLAVSFLFNLYFFTESEFTKFVINETYLWLIFVTSLIAFGIGFGLNFGLDIFKHFIAETGVNVFERATHVYQTISILWIYMGTLMIFFSFSILEISKPVGSTAEIKIEYYLIYFLAMILGLLASLISYKETLFIKRISVVLIIFISISIIWFTFESGLNIVSQAPLTSSFLIFSTSFIFITSTTKDFFKISKKEEKHVNDYTYFIEQPQIESTNRSLPLRFDSETLETEVSIKVTSGK